MGREKDTTQGTPTVILQAMYFEQFDLFLHKLNYEILVDVLQECVELVAQVMDLTKFKQVAQTLTLQILELVEPCVMQPD